MPTPESWRFDLEQRLDEQTRNITIFENYYDGDHRMAFVTAKFREAFGEIFQTLVDNWCEIVVDAPVERLAIEGFRFGNDQAADEDAWRIWKANRMPSQSVMAHSEAVKCGMSFVMVAPNPDDSGTPRLTVEHPSQVVIEHAAGDRGTRLAALKRWQGLDGHTYCTLYLPNEIHKWRSLKPGLLPAIRGGNSPFTRPFSRLARSLKWEQESSEDWAEREAVTVNPLGEVPIFEIANNPSMLYGGRSDLASAIPLQDAINKEVADMLIASEFTAFPQRVVMGLEIPTDENGEPMEGFELKAAMSRIWAFEDPDTKIGEFKAADLDNYVKATTMLLQHLAAQTRTPPHYLLGQIVNASGDALKAAETGLVSKVKRKQLDFADTWEDAMGVALRLAGRSESTELVETIWRDPEYRSEGELVDAAVKLKEIGIPFEALWERIGASQQQIARWSHLMDLPERRPFGRDDNNGAMPKEDAKSDE